MDIDQLKNLWTSTSDEEADYREINISLLNEASISKVRGLLSEFTLNMWLEHIFNLIFFILTIGYLVDNMYQVKFAAAALVLAILFAYDVFWSIRHLYNIYTLDYDTPITIAQKRIESFILYEKRDRNMLYWMIPIFWVSLLIVCAEAFLGLDLYALPIFLLIQFVAGLIIAPFIVLLLKVLRDRKMDEANEFLQEISEFEQEHDPTEWL